MQFILDSSAFCKDIFFFIFPECNLS